MVQKMLESSAISAFCGSVATMISAGIQTDEAVVMLADNREPSLFQGVCEGIYRRLVKGSSFAQAVRDSGAFPDYAVTMIETGEQSGHLEPVLRNLEMYYDEEDRMFSRMRSALGYPVALLAVMAVILFFTSLFILPVFNGVYEGIANMLSAESILSIVLSRSIGWSAFVVTALCTAGASYLLVSSLTERGRVRVVRYLERSPLTSKPMYQLALSRFAASLATYISSGVTSEEALGRALHTVEHKRLRKGLQAAHESMLDLDSPRSLVQAIGETDVFEPLYVRMMTVGARSGSFDETLSQLSQTFFDDALLQLDRAIDHVEPILAVLLTMSVGATLIAVTLPLVGIMGSIG